jgi:hypothetical protein
MDRKWLKELGFRCTSKNSNITPHKFSKSAGEEDVKSNSKRLQREHKPLEDPWLFRIWSPEGSCTC